MPYTVMVTGSRTWTNWDTIRALLKSFYRPGARLIHGACPYGGADEMADRLGREIGYAVQKFPPEHPWAKYFHTRNDEMLDEQPDVVLAFRSTGKSNGTDSVVRKAKERGLRVLVTEEVEHGRRDV